LPGGHREASDLHLTAHAGRRRSPPVFALPFYFYLACVARLTLAGIWVTLFVGGALDVHAQIFLFALIAAATR
jgi:hypothetical protein